MNTDALSFLQSIEILDNTDSSFTSASIISSGGITLLTDGIGIINNGLSFFYNTTDSQNTSTGSLIISGGIGVNGKCSSKSINTSNATIQNLHISNLLNAIDINVNGNIVINGSTSVLAPVNNNDATTKLYVDNLVANLLNYRGGYDASTNLYPIDGSGLTGNVKKGDTWVISIDGFLGGEFIQAGDIIVANINTPGQTYINWNNLNSNISYVPENEANKVTFISSSSNNIQYATAKLLYDQLLLKQTLLVSGTNISSLNGNSLLNGGDLIIGGSKSVNSGNLFTNNSLIYNVVENMSLLINYSGSYSVYFNAECSVPTSVKTTGFSTATAASDLNLIYNDIIAIPPTNTSHPLAFGLGEVLLPGVYYIAGAVSIAGTLTLNGGGNSNALFIIRSTEGAFNTGAGVTVNLINQAQSSNVFWVAAGAIGIGAGTVIPGILFSGAAIAIGANCTISGRLFTKSGAIASGPGNFSVPTGQTSINYRSLENFVIFTASGGVSNTGISTYTGNIATDLGAITGFETATVNGTIYQAGSTTTIIPIYHIATFSIYINGNEIPNSSRKRNTISANSDISLHCVTTLLIGDIVQIRCKVDNQLSDNGGIVNVTQRVLTINRTVLL